LSREKLMEMGKAAARGVESSTWEKIAAQYLDVSQKLTTPELLSTKVRLNLQAACRIHGRAPRKSLKVKSTKHGPWVVEMNGVSNLIVSRTSPRRLQTEQPRNNLGISSVVRRFDAHQSARTES